jgi:hypothetical protein
MSGVKSSHIPAHQEADGLVYLPYMKRYAYKSEELDPSTFKKSFPIPAGTLVLGVLHRVTEQFAGGTPAIMIGDSSGAERWASLNGGSADDILPGTLNHVFCSLNKGGMQPKYYPSADRIELTGVTGLTQGEGEVYVIFGGKEN